MPNSTNYLQVYGACVYSNVTLYGVESAGVRYTWAVWNALVLLTSLFGDTTIIIASIGYNAIQVHAGLIPFIQHLAIADLILAVFYVLPEVISVVFNGWVLGQAFCALTAYLSYYVFSLSFFLIAGMTSGKLLMVLSPMRARVWSSGRSQGICAVMWVFCLGLPLTQSLVDKTDVCFDSRKYNCTYGYTGNIWGWLKPVLFFVMALLPGMTIFGTSILLLKKARSVIQEGLRLAGMLTVLVTSGVYIFSILPFVAYSIVEPFLEKDPTKVGQFQLKYYSVACAFLNFHIMSNFFIYYFTVSKFRKFVRGIVCREDQGEFFLHYISSLSLLLH